MRTRTRRMCVSVRRHQSELNRISRSVNPTSIDKDREAGKRGAIEAEKKKPEQKPIKRKQQHAPKDKQRAIVKVQG